MSRLRLLKVIVQPVFILSDDDGENPVEQVASPLTVPASEWPAYAASGFAQSVEQLRQQVEGPAVQVVRDPDEATG